VDLKAKGKKKDAAKMLDAFTAGCVNDVVKTIGELKASWK